MDLEELGRYAQIIKTGVIILGGSALGVLGYKVMKARKELAQVHGDLSRNLGRAQETLTLARKLGGEPSYKDLMHFQNVDYPKHIAQLKEIQEYPERYLVGIFEIKKKGQAGDFSTYVIKRTQGLVELIEDIVGDNKLYDSAASFVPNKEKSVSRLYIKKDNNSGIAEFPRTLSREEKDSVLNNKIAYEEKYSCYDEGEFLGLLQRWNYNLEVLEGNEKGFKLKEEVTV